MSERIALKPGIEATVDGRRFRIQHVLDLETVLACDIESGEVKRLKVRELEAGSSPLSNTPPATGDQDLMTVSDDAWQIARVRFAVIQPLLSTSRCTRAQISEQARAASVDTATIYRWL